MSQGRFMSVKDIAEEYGCGLRTAYRIAHQCNPATLPGGRDMRIARIDFENWIRKQRERRAWQRGLDLDSSDEDASITHGSQGPVGVRNAGRPTAPTSPRREPKPASSSVEPRTRPIKPRTRPRPSSSPTAS